ncbi:hypothetical protein DL93DRAFT_1920936 [Clavulina sp. PMI_390]|nr:hypothetical protein DL93DRAFT_1920936 [Clavulina sp. PMI_390]
MPHTAPPNTSQTLSADPPVPRALTTLQASMQEVLDALAQRASALMTLTISAASGSNEPTTSLGDLHESINHTQTLAEQLEVLRQSLQFFRDSHNNRIDDEIDASYLLEMNYALLSFRNMLQTGQDNFPQERKSRHLRHFMEVVLTWTAHCQPRSTVQPRVTSWSRLTKKLPSFHKTRAPPARQACALESHFLSERKPAVSIHAHANSTVSNLYNLNDYLEWTTNLKPTRAKSATDFIGPCREIFLCRRNDGLTQHEFLIYGFGRDTPTSWCRIDRVACVGDAPSVLAKPSSRELVCFALTKEALIPMDTEELGAIIVEIPFSPVLLVFIGEVNRYIQQSVLDFPETTLFAANNTYFARMTMYMMVIIMTRIDRDAEDKLKMSVTLCWGDAWDVSMNTMIDECRNSPPRKFYLDNSTKVLAKAEARIHRSFIRDWRGVNERKQFPILDKAKLDLLHLANYGIKQARMPAIALIIRAWATTAYRYYLLGEWDNVVEASNQVAKLAGWTFNAKPSSEATFPPLQKEVFGGVVITCYLVNLAFIRLSNWTPLKKNGEAMLEIANALSSHGNPSCKWTLVLAGVKSTMARGWSYVRPKTMPPDEAFERAFQLAQQAEDLMTAMHQAHPAITTTMRRVLALLSHGGVLWKAKRLTDAFEKAQQTMPLLRQNKPRDGHHCIFITWALSCFARWSTCLGKYPEGLNGCQEALVHNLWCPSEHLKDAILDMVWLPLEAILLRKRTFFILETRFRVWPLTDYAEATDKAREACIGGAFYNSFLLGDLLSSQAWAIFNKDPKRIKTPARLEQEAFHRFDMYRAFQHPRAHFQAIRSLAMLSLYRATTGNLAGARDACDEALQRIKEAELKVRFGAFIEVVVFVNDLSNHLLLDGRMEDGARLRATAWKIRELLITISKEAALTDPMENTAFFQTPLSFPDPATRTIKVDSPTQKEEFERSSLALEEREHDATPKAANFNLPATPFQVTHPIPSQIASGPSRDVGRDESPDIKSPHTMLDSISLSQLDPLIRQE